MYQFTIINGVKSTRFSILVQGHTSSKLIFRHKTTSMVDSICLDLFSMNEMKHSKAVLRFFSKKYDHVGTHCAAHFYSLLPQNKGIFLTKNRQPVV